MKMYWWTAEPNFGDALSPEIVHQILGESIEYSEGSNKLIGVGTVLNHCTKSGDTVWGTGCGDDHSSLDFRNVTVLATRGPLTRKVILSRKGKCPEVYGDPAILTGILFPKERTNSLDVLAVPHMIDDIGWNFCKRNNIPTANPRWTPQRVISKIATTALVISSSLHGVIVAESYGIPAIWVKPTVYTSFKVDDYYQGTGRKLPAIVSWEAALKIKAEPFTPDRSKQEKLINSLKEHYVTM